MTICPTVLGKKIGWRIEGVALTPQTWRDGVTAPVALKAGSHFHF